MIAVLIALILTFAPATSEAPAQTVQAVEAVQTPQEQALEASAWESLDMLGTIDIITEDSIVDYSHTVTVEDGGYTVGPYQFAVVDPYDDVYVHIFNVEALYHA